MDTARDAAIDQMAAALQINPAQVSETTALGITPEWDSLAHLRLVLGIETRLGRQLTPDEIVSLASLRDVVALLAACRA